MYICVFFPSSESNLYILSLGLFVFDIKFIFSSKFLLKTYPKKKHLVLLYTTFTKNYL